MPAPHRLSRHSVIDAVLLSHVLQQFWGRESRCVSIPTHCAPRTLRGLEVTEDMRHSQIMTPGTTNDSQKLIDEKRPSTPDSSREKSLKKNDESLPAHPSILSNQLHDVVEITTPMAMQLECASKGQLHAGDALYGPGGYEYIILRMESQELSTRK